MIFDKSCMYEDVRHCAYVHVFLDLKSIIKYINQITCVKDLEHIPQVKGFCPL